MNGKTPVSGSFSYAYYVGNSASGTPSATAPTKAGTYTVVATFTSSDPDYTNGSAQTTFTIRQATPTVRVKDASGSYNGKMFAATASDVGVDGKTPVSGSLSLAYYVGSRAPALPRRRHPPRQALTQYWLLSSAAITITLTVRLKPPSPSAQPRSATPSATTRKPMAGRRT